MNTWLLSLVIVPILVPLLLNMISNEEKNENVHAPRSIHVLALVFGSLAVLALLSQFHFHGNNNVWAIGGGLGLLSLLFVVIDSSLRICYDEKTFTVRRFFSRALSNTRRFNPLPMGQTGVLFLE